MDIQSKVLTFADIYGAAHLLDPAHVYEKQDELRAYCRSAGKPFLYQIPVRHRLKCKACGVETGEVHLYFEDPSQPLDELMEALSTHPDPAAGYFCPINFTTLHGIIVHGEAMPEDLRKLFSRVRT